MSSKDLLRNVKLGPYRVRLWDTNDLCRHLKYELRHNGRIIFTGGDLKPALLHAIDIDSDSTLISLLSFLSLKPGDTDQEYFDSYTPAQLEFAENEGEYLQLICMEIDEINKKLKDSRFENLEDLIFDIEEDLEDHKRTYHPDMGNYLEIRLQVLLSDSSYQLHTGSQQYDTDHNGVWANTTISFKADYYDIYLAAQELIESIEEQI